MLKAQTETARNKKLSMVALKHKAVADRLSENIEKNGNRITVTQAAIDAGYSESYAKSGHLKDTETWEQLMEKYIPDSKLAKVHAEGLEAVKVGGDPEYFARHKYLDSAYKLKKRYDNTLKLKHEFGNLTDEDLEGELARVISRVSEGLAALGGEKKKGDK